jgi:GAF domain-containing protein
VDAFFAFHGAEAADPTPSAAIAPAPVPPAEDDSKTTDVLDLLIFFELGRALSHSTQLSGLIEILWNHLQSKMPAATLVLYTYDSASDSIVAAAEAGTVRSGLRADVRVPLGQGLSGWVAATGETVMNSDARLDLDEVARERSPLQSALAVQIMSGPRLAGVLSAYACKPDAFSDPHRRLMQGAALALGSLLADPMPHSGRLSGIRRVS